MSEVILVLDKPIDCMHCILLADFNGDRYRCGITYIPIKNDKAKSHCPLKSMPKKIPQSLIDEVEEKNLLTNACRYKGYNDCIDEILGKETKDD